MIGGKHGDKQFDWPSMGTESKTESYESTL